mmetsp:Transcript_30847/g.77443  ORF Transcript_30847/g.77443 Transcript_30847/m.77443 type:complete len:1144 (+) Transcript_30847:146-3577(+)
MNAEKILGVLEQNKFVRAYNSFIATSFGHYGAHCAQPLKCAILFGFGILIMTGFSLGLFRKVETSNIYDLWVIKGTQLESDEEFYSKHFGSSENFGAIFILTRESYESNIAKRSDVLIQPNTTAPSRTKRQAPSTGVASQVGLDSIVNVLDNYYGDGSVGMSLDDIIHVTVSVTPDKDGIQAKKGETTELKISAYDVCSKVEVPSFFRPYPPGQLYWLSGAIISGGYRDVALCTANFTVPPDYEYQPPDAPMLPDGWGISRFPCNRASLLDCFQEGGDSDYPDELRLLDEWADYVYFHPQKDECIQRWADGATALVLSFGGGVDLTALGISGGDVDASVVSAAFADYMASSVDTMWQWGWRWKRSYNSMSDEEIVAHLDEAIRNAQDEDVTIQQCIAENLACCTAWNGLKLYEALIMSGLTYSNGNLTKVDATQVGIQILSSDQFVSQLYMEKRYGITNQETIDDIWVEYDQATQVWLEQRWKQTRGTGYASGEEFENLQLVFITEDSLQQMLTDANQIELLLLIVAVILVIAFTIFAMSSWWHCPPALDSLLYSHVLLAVAGFCIVCGSVVAGIGLTALLGVNLNAITYGVAPFLGIGLGVDDMLVFTWLLVQTTKESQKPERMMRKTLALAGPSVLLTSVANAVAFAVSSTFNIPAVTEFCLAMCLIVVTNFIFLFTLFVPLMALDARRITALRSDIVPVKLPPPSESKRANNIFSTFVVNYYGKFVTNPIVKAVVIICSLAFFGVTIWNAVANIEVGLQLSDIALKNTYQKDFIDAREEYFPTWDIKLVTKRVDYSNPKEQAKMVNAMENISKNKNVASTTFSIFEQAWLSDSQSSFLYFANGANRSREPLKEDFMFYPLFWQWMSTVGVVSESSLSCYDGDRIFLCTQLNATTSKIVASQMTFFYRDVRTDKEIIEANKSVREAVEQADSEDMFLYGMAIRLWEQYITIERDLYFTCGMALLAIFGVTLLLQMSPLTALCVVLFVVVIFFELYGTMVWIDVKLNAFALVNLVVAIGYSVEFTAHLARAFLLATGSRDSRAIKSLEEMAYPLLMGAGTTFVALIPLSFAQFPFFRKYYFVMYTVMIGISLVNGCLVLPVVLSLVGPPSIKIPKDFKLRSHTSIMNMRKTTSAEMNVAMGE